MKNEKNEPKAVYPLKWPVGRPRVAPDRRRADKFKLSFADSYDAVIDEVEKLGGTSEVTISSDVPLRRDGLPETRVKAVVDPAVTLYFKRDGRSYAIAQDAYVEVRANLRAIAITIASLRTQQRHGAGPLMEQDVCGLLALEPAQDAQVVRRALPGEPIDALVIVH